MSNWGISATGARAGQFSSENHSFVLISDFLNDPDGIIHSACLQNFAKVTPQYPGVRAALPKEVQLDWVKTLAPLLNSSFGEARNGWEIQAWFSLVTSKPADLIPLQCFPHVDGTDPNQLAMMLYLHRTKHGGTAFFRHKSTGYESLTDENFPNYRAALEADVRKTGLPPRAYPTDGEPHFERIHAVDGAFNEAVFYRGNILHSGIIDQSEPLPDDPAIGRLTINAFFRPK